MSKSHPFITEKASTKNLVILYYFFKFFSHFRKMDVIDDKKKLIDVKVSREDIRSRGYLLTYWKELKELCLFSKVWMICS